MAIGVERYPAPSEAGLTERRRSGEARRQGTRAVRRAGACGYCRLERLLRDLYRHERHAS